MRYLIAIVLTLVLTSAHAQEKSYRFRAGDVVDIWVGQDPTLNRQVVVRPDGRISLPLAGHLVAEGLAPEELEEELRARLQKNFREELDLTVMLATPNQDRVATVYMIGDIPRPGEYAYRPGMTILHAVSLAGGFLRPNQIAGAGGGVIVTQAELDGVRSRLQELTVREARLRAEIEDRRSLELPAEIVAAMGDPALASFVKQEELVLNARRSNAVAEVEARERNKTAIAAEVSALQAQLELNQRQQDLVNQELTSVRTLVTKGLATSAREMDVLRSKAGIESAWQRLTAALIRAEGSLKDNEAVANNSRDQRRYALLTELQVTQREADTLRGRLAMSQAAPAPDEGNAEELAAVYEYTILRLEDGQMNEIPGEELTEIKPGDLIKVKGPPGLSYPAGLPEMAATQEALPLPSSAQPESPAGAQPVQTPPAADLADPEETENPSF